VQDLAEAHVAAYTYLQNNGKNLTVNLGTGKGASVLDVLNAAKKITGRDIPYEIVDRRRGDPPAVIASAKLAEKLIGWNPKYSDIETILKTTANLYLTA
jgi:UDP-glucose 4-epimerase